MGKKRVRIQKRQKKSDGSKLVDDPRTKVQLLVALANAEDRLDEVNRQLTECRLSNERHAELLDLRCQKLIEVCIDLENSRIELAGRHRSKEPTNFKDVLPPSRPGSVDEVFSSLLDEK